MNLDTVANVISTLGFPITCCVALFWKMGKSEESHKTEVEALRQTIEHNTEIITKMYEHFIGDN